MLVDYYVGALLAEEGLADDIWELWDAGMISDDLAAWAWWLVAHLEKIDSLKCPQECTQICK
jgi:hypothetical protein